ncbi:MAG: ABC transporter permease [Vicinamibacterales bacterium]
MRWLLAFVLVAHGVAHLVGFVSSWKLATLPELPYKTAVFAGRIDVGDAGIRVIGVLWLLTALAFLIDAGAVVMATDWAGRLMIVAVIASLLLCMVGWPDARIGVAVNLGLVVLLAIGARLNVAALAALTP